MKIFIPMAGKGTRLRPFTLTCPKPLINVLDKPIVEHLIDQITSKVKSNIDEIVYILGDESYFNTDKLDLSLNQTYFVLPKTFSSTKHFKFTQFSSMFGYK